MVGDEGERARRQLSLGDTDTADTLVLSHHAMPWRHMGGRRGGFEGCLISPIEGEEATTSQSRSSSCSGKSSIKGPQVSLHRCLLTITSSALLSSSNLDSFAFTTPSNPAQ